MSYLLEIPKRTIGDWETGTRKPPAYVEKLVIRELDRIATENNTNNKTSSTFQGG